MGQPTMPQASRADARPAAPVELVRLGGIEQSREEWTLLQRRTDNVFLSWEWADVWWRHFGADREPWIHAVCDQDGPVAILPLCLERLAGLRLIRFVGHGVADELGLVCDAEAMPSAFAGLGEALSGGGTLLAERMPADREWAEVLGGFVVNREPSPIIDLAGEGSWEEYLQARSANFRQQVRRRRKRLEGLGVRFRLTEDERMLPRDMSALLALHEARWGEESQAFAGVREVFHREFASRALERGWLRLWIAEAEGAPVAAWYGFRFGGVESYYQLGRDPGWDRVGIGVGILEHSIREAFADGMREYRLLVGGESYKSRYASHDIGLVTVAASRRYPDRAALAAGRLALGSKWGRRLLRPLSRRTN